MKQINIYIVEKLRKISSKTSKHIEKKYFPQDDEELKQLVDKLINERGLNADLNDIDTSKITYMGYLFFESNFNGDISEWDVSNVTDMQCMFRKSSFNGDISEWDVSNVENMTCMFDNSKFEGDISNWDVSNVKHMSSLFESSNFDGDLSHWDVSNVINMQCMFEKAKFTGKNGDISYWDVSKVMHIYDIFSNSKFIGNIDHWKVNNYIIHEPLKDIFKNTPLESNPPKWHVLYGWKDPGYSIFDKKNEANIEKMLKASNSGFSVNDVEDKFKYKQNGDATLFWKCWVTAVLHGPLSKEKLLKKKNEIDNNAPQGAKYWSKPTSYTSLFTQWSKEERFKHIKGGLYPNKQKDWKI